MNNNYNPIRPAYYDTDLGQPIDFITRFRLPFNLGNVVKYLPRAGKKEKDVYDEDYRKAKYYLDSFVEFNNYKNYWSDSRPRLSGYTGRTKFVGFSDEELFGKLEDNEDFRWAKAYAGQFQHDIECILIDIALWAWVPWDVEAFYYLTDAQRHLDSLIASSYPSEQ